MSRETETEPNPATQSAKVALEHALRSNLRLQAGLLRRLEKIAALKAENRRKARLASVTLLRKWEDEDARARERSAYQPLDGKELKKLVGRERRRRERERYAERDEKDSDEVGSDSSSTHPTLPTVAQMSRRWAYKEDRKWTRRFFVDPDGCIPDPNGDVVRRSRDEADVPFLYRCIPWAEAETERLKDAVDEVRRLRGSEKSANYAGDSNMDQDVAHSAEVSISEIDFDSVASLLKQDLSENDVDSAKRSAAECRTKYLAQASPSIDTSSLTTEQSCKISELVRLHNGHPPWDVVAASLGPGRTPWQCFQHHVTDKPDSTSVNRPWTPEEDELLLKYIAAHGPGFLLNPKGAAADAAARLFPDRTVLQVSLRAHSSLLNPNYKNEAWSEEEERRLALCMRVYRDAPSPLARACVHFPDRASKSVSEKWLRSLNPEITYKPFTKKEDRILLQAIDKMGGPGSCSWVQLARQHFPSRNPRSLKYRWMEVANDEDIVKKYSEKARNQCRPRK